MTTMTTMTAAATSTGTAAERARRLWDDDPASTAAALLRELLEEEDANPGTLAFVLLPWITDRVRATIRSQVRSAEESAWANPSGSPQRTARVIRSQAGPLPALDNLELLLSLPVLVPAAGNRAQAVPWRDLTASDHRARIGMLRKPLGAIRGAIERHEWSVREIEKYGVRTLGDISPATLRRDMRNLSPVASLVRQSA